MDIEQVVARLDAVTPLWRALPVGGELIFEWPQVTPREQIASGLRISRAAR